MLYRQSVLSRLAERGILLSSSKVLTLSMQESDLSFFKPIKKLIVSDEDSIVVETLVVQSLTVHAPDFSNKMLEDPQDLPSEIHCFPCTCTPLPAAKPFTLSFLGCFILWLSHFLVHAKYLAFWFIPPKAQPFIPLCSSMPCPISKRTLYWPLFMVNVPSPIVLLS